LFFSLFLDTLIDGPVSVFSVAKSTSVFDDPTAGIQNLTAAVNKDITALKATVLHLQILIKSQKRGWKNFTRCSESFNCDSRHPERKPNEHHKGIQRSFDHEGKG